MISVWLRQRHGHKETPRHTVRSESVSHSVSVSDCDPNPVQAIPGHTRPGQAISFTWFQLKDTFLLCDGLFLITFGHVPCFYFHWNPVLGCRIRIRIRVGIEIGKVRLGLAAAGVDGRSKFSGGAKWEWECEWNGCVRSLVSLHQSLISFIFSENNHFGQHM